MSARAVILGLLIGLAVASSSYFIGAVMQQPSPAYGLFPPAVIGALVVLVLIVGPVTVRAGLHPLRPGELAMIAALGLAACHFPGAVFANFLNKLMAPAHWHKVEPVWQATEVMSYVPGGSARLGRGHLHDVPALGRRLHRAGDGDAAWVMNAMSPSGRDVVARLASHTAASEQDVAVLLAALNELIERGEVPVPIAASGSAHSVRHWLAAQFPVHVMPVPAGAGVLPSGGQTTPEVTDALLTGSPDVRWPWHIPWQPWVRTLVLWIGLAILFAGLWLAMALVVHPQWSQRELLAYPVARFVSELTRPDPGRAWPAVAQSRFFWVGAGCVLLIRLTNGLHAWFPEHWFLLIPLQLDFSALTQLFPTAAQVGMSDFVFRPTFDPILIGFAFFLSGRVCLGLGLAGIAWLIFGSLLIVRGLPAQSVLFGHAPPNMMLCGAYLGWAVMVLYIGRRHYLAVAAHGLGLRTSHAPGYCVWAARAMSVCFVLAWAMLVALAGMQWVHAAIAMLLTTVVMLMTARIHVETGATLIHPYWFAFSILPPLLGFDAVGPTNFIVMAVMASILIESTHAALMPYLSDGLRMCDRPDGAAPGRTAWPLAAMLMVSLMAAGLMTFTLGYHHGTNKSRPWGFRDQPSLPFTQLSQYVQEATAVGTIEIATSATTAQRWGLIRWDGESLGWIGAGVVLTTVCAAARLRLPWWPLHPVLFLVMGTYYGVRYAPSFLLGWLIRAAIVQTVGAKGYEQARPLFVGLIAGEVLAVFLSIVLASVYHLATGQTPPVAIP